MSYDVIIGEWSGNMTSNVSQIWDTVMPEKHLRDMSGERAGDMHHHFVRGAAKIADELFNEKYQMLSTNPPPLKEMEPKNGWGCCVGAMKFLLDMAVASHNFPEAEISVYL